MRAADLLTILTKSPKKTEYQGVFLAQEQKLVPVTMVQINKANQFIFLFEHGKAPLAMKDIFLFFVRAVRLRQDKLVGKKERNVYT